MNSEWFGCLEIIHTVKIDGFMCYKIIFQQLNACFTFLKIKKRMQQKLQNASEAADKDKRRAGVNFSMNAIQ